MRLKNIMMVGLCIALGGCQIPALSANNGNEEPEKNVIEFDDKKIEEELKGRWYYDNLSKEERRVYNIIYDGIVNWETEIALDSVPIDTVKKIDNLILAEHPELFYVALKYVYKYAKGEEDLVLEYNPTYCMTKSEYQEKLAEVDGVTNEIISYVQSQTTEEYETELLVHDYMVEHIDYFTDNEQDTGDDLASFRTIYGALVEGKANCMGYASTFTYLMNKLNIQCGSMIGSAVTASGNKESHEWNFVNINDNWYFTDVCWDDPTSDGTDTDLDTGIRHGYFNLTSEEMRRTREFRTNLNERGDVPEAVNNDCNYYLRNGLIVNSVEEYQGFVNTYFETMINDGTYLELQFTDEDEYASAMASLSDIVSASAGFNYYYGTFYFQGVHDDRMNLIVLSITID